MGKNGSQTIQVIKIEMEAFISALLIYLEKSYILILIRTLIYFGLTQLYLIIKCLIIKKMFNH